MQGIHNNHKRQSTNGPSPYHHLEAPMDSFAASAPLIWTCSASTVPVGTLPRYVCRTSLAAAATPMVALGTRPRVFLFHAFVAGAPQEDDSEDEECHIRAYAYVHADGGGVAAFSDWYNRPACMLLTT